MTRYQVLAPLIQLKLKDQAGAWVIRQFGAGALLDRDDVEFDDANFQSHLDSGQVVEEGTPVAEVFAVPAGTPLPGKPPNVAVTESGDAASTGQPVPPLSADLLRAADIDATGDEEWAAESTDRDADRVARGGRPSQVSSKADWVDYAVSQRADDVSESDARAEAEAKTKAELVAEYK